MISIVSTLFGSELYIEEFVERCDRAAVELRESYEIVLVDDGSPDRSLDRAVALIDKYECLRVVELSRNFGHHAAMLCGLEHARGDRIFLIDSDLEEAPEWLPVFERELRDLDCDVVYGVQSKRRERGLVRIASEVHYRLRRALIDPMTPQDVTTCRIMTRAYVEALLLHQETTAPILDLWSRTGFDQRALPVEKRRSSSSTYSAGARAKWFIDTFVVGSGRLLTLSSIAGIVTVAAAALVSVGLFVRWLAFSRPSPGWTSVMLATLVLGGAILFTVSLIGLNLTRVADEVRRRPRTIVRRIHEH